MTEPDLVTVAGWQRCPVDTCQWDTRGTNGGAGTAVCQPGVPAPEDLSGCLVAGPMTDAPDSPCEDAEAAVARVRRYCRDLVARSLEAVPATEPEEGSEEEAAAEANAGRYFVAQRVLQLLDRP